MYLCQDDETGKSISIPENSRYQSMFVCGGSGTGKTSLIYEPLFARDLERKSFFREVSKEMGFTALKTNIASLPKPYTNEYINKNFSLNMLSPSNGKEAVYNAYIKKMILGNLDGHLIYKNLGLTLMSPDYEVIGHMQDVCNNYGFEYNIIDPENSASIGLNPFIYDKPSKIAITISSALKAMYNDSHPELQEAYREDIAMQVIENLAILLKEMYPRMNEGSLPNMEDMLKMLTNFDLIEKMCEIMAHDEELKEKYSIQLEYFKKNFYKNGSNKDNTEKNITLVISQLDSLLRLPGVKSILCNRHNNLNFDDMLSNGDITFVCTRRGDLGASSHKAFGLFFLISMQNAVLRRPGSESTRIPHFLYVDEFPDFLCKSTEAIFTMYRKYKVGSIISAQNLAQLDMPTSKESLKNTLLSNCVNKIFTGNGVYSELEWWSAEFGKKREWKMSNTIDFDKMKYDPKHGSVEWKFVDYFNPGRLQGSISDKKAAYKIKGAGGKTLVGLGKFNYLEAKYKEKQKTKSFDFGKYSDRVTTPTEDTENGKNSKFNLRNVDFTNGRNEVDPVQTNISDSKYIFDNEDAIVVNFKNKKNKK